MTTPQLGDIIFIKKEFYHHYGIYVNDNEVWHYDQKSKNKFGRIIDTITCNGIIRSTSYEYFHEGFPVYICRFNELVIEELYRYKFIDFKLYKILLMKIASVLPLKLSLAIWGADFLRNAHDKAQETYTEEHRAAMNIFSPEETVERARQCINEENYNLLKNNCEHFSIWCKTGVKESIQIEKIQEVLLEYAVAANL